MGVFLVAGAGGSLAQAYGTYMMNTSLLTDCTGGAANVTVTFNDPAELYGNSEATVSITLSAACSVCAFQHAAWPSCTSQRLLYAICTQDPQCKAALQPVVLYDVSW